MSWWCSPIRHHVARKHHHCELCSAGIHPGVRYATWRCRFDDHMSTVKVHVGCWALVLEHGEPDGGVYELSPDGLAEDLRYHCPDARDLVRVGGPEGWWWFEQVVRIELIYMESGPEAAEDARDALEAS